MSERGKVLTVVVVASLLAAMAIGSAATAIANKPKRSDRSHQCDRRKKHADDGESFLPRNPNRPHLPPAMGWIDGF